MKYVKLLKIFTVIYMMSGVVSCVAPSRYEWGNYQMSLYNYTKHPEQRSNYEKSLLRAIETGKKNNNLAPGLLAELGYLKLETGDTNGAIELFEQEKKSFPESSFFLDKTIQSLKQAPSS